MQILQDILATLTDGKIIDIAINENWTAVVVEVEGMLQCGLASNPVPVPADKSGYISYLINGQSEDSALALSGLAAKPARPEASAGMAAINALLPKPRDYLEENANDLLSRIIPGRKSVMVGHFSFIEDLKTVNQDLTVLELLPQEGDLHVSKAPEILPQAEVVAITSMTLINGTLTELLDLCSPEATTLIIGPSTPFSPVLFDYGIDALCGTLVVNIDRVVDGISSGKKFRHLEPDVVRKAIAFRKE
jgi:hypothetical protein